MKYIPLIVFIIVFLFGFLGALFQLETANLTGAVFHEKTVRLFVFPKSTENFDKIKNLNYVKVRHDFDEYFSADVGEDFAKNILELADVKLVHFFQILGEKNKRSCYLEKQFNWDVSEIVGGKGSGVNVAILDTGIVKHPDIIVSLCKDTTKGGSIDGCLDENGHGIHLAGIIGAYGGTDKKGMIGISPEANLNIIKVCNNDGTCFADDVLAGLNYAVEKNNDIVLMSFGMNDEFYPVAEVFDKNKNILFIAAAGGKDQITFPATNMNTLAVKSLETNQKKAVYDGMFFLAPGLEIESTWKNGCYEKMSGSSVAAAHIAGLAAKLWNENSFKTRELMKESLER